MGGRSLRLGKANHGGSCASPYRYQSSEFRRGTRSLPAVLMRASNVLNGKIVNRDDKVYHGVV